MSLQLILGGSGAGKSHYLYHKIIEESMIEKNTNFLVIVPEQFTMETQKDFITMHPHHGIMNIDVLSFMRLSYRILEETGRSGVTVLEDTGKNMVLRRVLTENKDSLIYFKSNIRKPGFVDEVKSMLSELYQYNIGEEELNEMIELAKDKPLLHAKLTDLLFIYQKFRDFLKDRYITAEEIMDVLYDALEYSSIVKNSVICFDGFTGFTPSQLKVLERLMKDAKKVYATVTIDEREDVFRIGEDFQLFHLSKMTIYHLTKIAREQGIEILDPIYPSKEKGVLWRFANNPVIGALEKNLFRYPNETYLGEQQQVHIEEQKAPKDEVRFVVRKIREMIRNGNYRYRDFAVVSADMGSYGRIIDQEFSRAKIPFFLDDKRDIESNPFVVLMESLLEVIRMQMDYESMFHYLRCGMLHFDKEAVDALENYCLAFGIRGRKRWEQPFERCYGNLTEEELIAINETRSQVVESLSDILSLLSGSKHTVKEYVDGLYDTAIRLGCFATLNEYQEKFETEGNLLQAKEYGQVYNMIMELFERMMELLGEEEMTALEFKDILSAGVAKAKVGLIPTGIDQVVAGDIERTRLKDIRVLFFIGVNDGLVPKAVNGGGILSDNERELLKENKVELAPTRREKIYTERFYLYLNLTKPSEETFLTYCKTDTSGKAIKPSYLIGTILKLFPKTRIGESVDTWGRLEHMMDSDGGWDYMLEGIRDFEIPEDGEICWNLIYSWYQENGRFKEYLQHIIESAYTPQLTDKLSEAVAKALYGENLIGSVTRLEQFAACACAHYLSYGLRLRERQEFKINIPDVGNIFHTALELFSKKLKEQNLTWQTIEPEERERLGDECVREVAMEYGNTIFQSSKRNEYMIERISRILKRTLWALAKQLGSGDFSPAGYELKFSFMDDLESVRIPLSDHNEMRLTGRVDRLDTCEEEDHIYVKIVDYKSGKKAFSIQDLYYGLELQLVVYMGTMMEKVGKDNPDKEVVPAGIFYYNMDDPIIEKGDPMFYDNQILKELRVNGLVNQDPKVIKSLDRAFVEKDIEDLSPSVKSNVIPVETVKTGELSKNSSVVSKEAFQDIVSYARKKMIGFGKEIMDGSCEKNPYQLGDKTACDYCKYASVCGFDKKNAQDSYRILEKLSKDDIMQKIKIDPETAKADQDNSTADQARKRDSQLKNMTSEKEGGAKE